MNDSKNILLVEDDIDDQFFFVEALKEIPNTNLLAIANNGEEALRILQFLPILPDLIFMDINMPLLNGIECLKAIGNKPVIKDIPVVMLTTDQGSIDSVRQNGAKGFVNKSADAKTLIGKLEQIINLNFKDKDRIAKASFYIAK